MREADLGKQIGLGQAAVSQYKRRGMPCDSPAAALLWLERNVRGWDQKALQAPYLRDVVPPAAQNGSFDDPKSVLEALGAQETGRPENYDQARTRKQRAEADLAEIEVAKARGELVSRQTIELQWANICGRIRSALLPLPARLAPLLEQRPRKFIEETLDAELRQVFNMLADDGPQ